MIKIDKDVRKAYDNIFEILYKKFNDGSKAYQKMLEFLAVDNCPPIINDINDGCDWFFRDKNLAQELIKAYNLPLIKSSRYDYLGDIYIENIIGEKEANRKGLYLTPQHVAEFLCRSALDENSPEKVNILDPCTGTGRFLITANKYAPNARLFGVDINLTMIRTAFTNAAIHSIRVYLLNADFLCHETDLSNPAGFENWKYANSWQSHMDKLKPIHAHMKNHVQYGLFKK